MTLSFPLSTLYRTNKTSRNHRDPIYRPIQDDFIRQSLFFAESRQKVLPYHTRFLSLKSDNKVSHISNLPLYILPTIFRWPNRFKCVSCSSRRLLFLHALLPVVPAIKRSLQVSTPKEPVRHRVNDKTLRTYVQNAAVSSWKHFDYQFDRWLPRSNSKCAKYKPAKNCLQRRMLNLVSFLHAYFIGRWTHTRQI